MTTIFKDPPKTGKLIPRSSYANFNPRQVLRLGPNLFLVRYTEDAKGTSKAIRIGIVEWQKYDNLHYPPNQVDEGWKLVGNVKSARRYGTQALRVWAGDYARKTFPIVMEGFLKDEPHDWKYAVNLMVNTYKALAPEAFDYSHVEDYFEELRR